MRWCMFDLETLATSPSAVVLTLGGVIFNPLTQEFHSEILLKFEIDEQISNGREVNDDTLNWWSKQSAEVQEAAFGDDGRLSSEECLVEFRKFVSTADKVWSQGSFDVNIMENFYKSMKMPVPWNYWAVRDSRTLFDFIEPYMDRSKHHDAMEDAKEQARGVCKALKIIGWKGSKLTK